MVALFLALPALASGLTCDELQQMAKSGIPEAQIVETVAALGLTADEVVCVDASDLPAAVKEAAQQNRLAAPAPEPEPQPVVEAPLQPFPAPTSAPTSMASAPARYCLMLATSTSLLSRKVSISVDYGEEASFLADQRVRDSAGRVAKFNSVIDAMNYLSSQGWVFVDAYAISTGGSHVYHFLFKR